MNKIIFTFTIFLILIGFGNYSFALTEDPVVASKEEVEFEPITDKEKKSRYNELVAKGNNENLKKLFDRLSEIKDEDGLPLLERDPNNPKECP